MKKTEIEDEYQNLQNDVNELTSKINQTFAIREKEHLQTVRGTLIAKVTKVQEKLDRERDANAWNDLVILLKQRAPYIVLEVNGAQIEISENLIVEISYRGCKHKQKLHIAEFLRYKKAINGNIQLFNAWQPILTETTEIVGRWWCEQCREEKESIRAKFFRYNDKDAGHARWSIKHFNLKVK
jgi:hypothetical protein